MDATPDDRHELGHNGSAHDNGRASGLHAGSGTVDKLFEQAMLNALSMLEDDELEAFEAAWRAAPRELQAQPDAELPGDMRERVRASVRAAMEAAMASSASRARAHGSQRDRRPVAGRSGGASAGIGAVLFRGRRVHHLWRAVAIGLAVAVVGLGALQMHVIRQTTAAGDMAVTGELLDRLGPGARDLIFGDNIQTLRLTATEAGGDAAGVLYRDTDTDSGRLFCSGLKPAASAYRVVALDGSGRVQRELAELRSSGPIASASVPALPKGSTLAVLPPSGQGNDPLLVLEA